MSRVADWRKYLVGRALGLASDGVRDEWAAFDLLTPSGLKVEVKWATCVQSWCQRALSAIGFVVPKTLGWDREANQQENEARRQADVDVFAVLAHLVTRRSTRSTSASGDSMCCRRLRRS